MTRLILAGVVVSVLGICSGSTSRSVTSMLHAAAPKGGEADVSRRSAAPLARAADPSRKSAIALARVTADLPRRSGVALARAAADLPRRSGVALARAAADGNWPQWRGPDGLGLAPASTYVD